MMRPIQMVDLGGQYKKVQSKIDNAISSVLQSSQFILGPEVKSFENEMAKYLGVKHVIGCANGTDALQIALMALNVKPGDEIITPTFTFISTAEVAALLGLKVVFADSLPDTFNIDPDSIKKAISPKTKAIIPVHLYGQCADVDAIMEIASEHHLSVIEDNAQALGADYCFSDGTIKKAGTIGTIGCTSFFPSKNLGAYGDAGAIFTDDDTLAEKLRALANHGQKTRYYFDHIGLNSRLDTIQAAILRVKLSHLEEYISARRKAAGFYYKTFSGNRKISIPHHDKKSSHAFHQYTLKFSGIDRDGLQEHLRKNGIPSVVYYPVPLHLQKAFQPFGYKKGDFPVAEGLCTQILSLPMHTELDEEQLQYITTKVNEYCS